MSESSDLTIAIAVDLQVITPTISYGSVEHFQVYVGPETANDVNNDRIITYSQTVQVNDSFNLLSIVPLSLSPFF